MSNELSDIQGAWQRAKANNPKATLNVNELIVQARQKSRSVRVEHFGNLLVLSGTTALLVIYFFFAYSFQDVLSQLGIYAMVGGLLVRIGVEVVSLVRSVNLRADEPTTKTLAALLAFHRLRKFIHGPLTLTIVVLYGAGLYALMPELSRYIDTPYFVLIHISIPVLAYFLVKVGRKGIRTEMKALEKLLDIQKHLV